MTNQELYMRKLVRESDVIDKTDGSELAQAFNTLWDKYVEAEPCEDTISRQAALDYIYNDLGLGDEENGKDLERQMELEDSYKYIKSLPPVTPKHRWIPVSERLPENRNQEVLICLEWGVDIGRYSDGEWHSEWINHYDDGNVLAWMPLPPRYEPQESEDKE